MRLRFEDNTLIVSGELSFASIKKIYQQGQRFIADKDVKIIDFGQAEVVDSSSLALLTSWLRYAKKCHKTITFQNLPKHLLDIAKLTDIDHLILTVPTSK